MNRPLDPILSHNAPAMAYDAAMGLPMWKLRTPDLWTAIKTIGAFKLSLRNSVPLANCLADLRVCNARIDALVVEEMDREQARAGRRNNQKRN